MFGGLYSGPSKLMRLPDFFSCATAGTPSSDMAAPAAAIFSTNARRETAPVHNWSSSSVMRRSSFPCHPALDAVLAELGLEDLSDGGIFILVLDEIAALADAGFPQTVCPSAAAQ